MMDLVERSHMCAMTSGDIARLLDVDLKTIHNWVRHGHLRGRRTKGRHLRFHRTEIVRFMRRFGYQIPESLGRARPRVVLVGLREEETCQAVAALAQAVQVDSFHGIFDAALVVAGGDYEVLVLDLDRFGQHLVSELMEALRRRPSTQGVAAVGKTTCADLQEHFLAAGGDVIIDGAADLHATVLWLTGAIASRQAVPQGPAVEDPASTPAAQKPAQQNDLPLSHQSGVQILFPHSGMQLPPVTHAGAH